MSLMIRDLKTPYAIVVGLDTMSGIQTARILNRHQVPVIAIAKDPKHPCCLTKTCHKILIADTKNAEFIKTLEDLGPKLNQRAVLYPCADMNVLLISRNREKLKKWYHIVLPSQEIVEMLMDKVRFYKYAQKKGFPIPPTYFLNSIEEAERAAQELSFPCILKPPMSSIPGWEENSKLKAYKISTPGELLALYDKCKLWAKDLIVQEWVEGPDKNLYSCNCYLNKQLKPLVTFVARKLRQWPPVTGESCLGEECREDAVLEETVRVFQAVGNSGLGYMEIKRDEKSGRFFIIEPNIGRPTGRSAIAEAGGVELIYTMYCDSIGLPLPGNVDQKYEGVKWISLRRDMQSALYHWQNGDLSIKEWLRSVRGPKAYHLFSWTDPAPFWGDLLRSVFLYLQPEERKKRDYRSN